MNRKTVIITETYPGRTLEAWGNLRKLCTFKGLVYNTVVKRKLPIIIDNLKINRVYYANT